MDPHFTKLLDAYLDGGLTPEGKAELEQLLLSSGEARTEFWRRAKLHSGLMSLAGEQWGEELAKAEENVLQLPTRRRTAWWIPASAAAAVILAFAGFFFMNDEPETTIVSDSTEERPTSSAIAVIERSAQTNWGNAAIPTPGEALEPGRELKLEAGLVELSFTSGARVIVKGPAQFTAASAMQLNLRSGTAQFDVPESAHGFEVITPGGTMRDLGTRFTARALDGERAELHVIEGRVELTPAGSTKPAELARGQAMAAADGTLQEISFAPTELDRELTLRLRFLAWKTQRSELIRDPDVLVYFTFEGVRSPARAVRNLSSRSDVPPTAAAEAILRTTAGRWPGQRAVVFGNNADRIQLRLDGRYPQVTYAAWVRVDSLPNRFNALFMSEHDLEGEAHWQIGPKGSIQFGIRPPESRWTSEYHQAFSQEGLVPVDSSVWIHLATTVDSENLDIRHFVNGQEAFHKMMREAVPIQFGFATLGNWEAFDRETLRRAGKEEAWGQRPWSGLIDEFVLFARTLDRDEIRTLYEAGRAE